VDWEYQKPWVDKAAQLGFEYYLADAGWEQRWDASGADRWTRLKELADYGKTKGVGIWVWCRWSEGDCEGFHMTGIETPEKKEAFFKNCSQAGAAGVKIDFMDSESKDRLDFYYDCLQRAARYKLMINFHGANKPTGEARTYPNEITREGLRGLEYNKWSDLPPIHYATLPFTRMLAGQADFTPCTLNPKFLKGTTVTLQLATTIVYTSPLTHWADNPDLYLASPAIELIRNVPTVWDETIVLPGSKIGELAAFARRKNNDWFVGIVNAGPQRDYELSLSFLGKGSYNGLLVYDRLADPTALDVTRQSVERHEKLKVRMNQGGGFAGWFRQK
jgi:alpha-glucosidase